MSKIVKFGGGDGYMTSIKMKSEIVDYLYENVNLYKIRYMMLNNISMLNFLRDNNHYICPNYNGYNYYVIFIKFEEERYCVAIEKKKLLFKKDQLDMKSFIVIKMNIVCNDRLYDGSIFDCKLINSNNKYIMLMMDCYLLFGKKLLMNMKDKMFYLDDILRDNFKGDYCVNFVFKINKLYEYDDIEKLIKDIIPNLELSSSGLIFIPMITGPLILYIEKKIEKVEILNDNKMEEKSYDYISNFVEFLKSRVYSYEMSDKTKILTLSRTNIPDVYDIINKDGKQDIALIPNLKISHLCNETIKNKPVKFKCVFSNKFKKWIPIQKVDF